MQHPAYMVVLASSLLKGEANSWWVHLWDEYAYDPDEEEEEDNEDAPSFNGSPRY